MVLIYNTVWKHHTKIFRLYLLEHKDEIYADGDLTISKEEILYKFEEYCQPNELWSDFEQQTENIISEISEKKYQFLVRNGIAG